MKCKHKLEVATKRMIANPVMAHMRAVAAEAIPVFSSTKNDSDAIKKAEEKRFHKQERNLKNSTSIKDRKLFRLGAEYAFNATGISERLTISDEEIDRVLNEYKRG